MSGISAASGASDGGTKMRLKPLLPRGGRHRQHPAEVAHRPLQGQLSDHQRVFQAVGGISPCISKHSHGDGQVVRGTFFADGRRRQVDDDALTGIPQPCILHRGLHARTALLHRLVRQADDVRSRQSLGGIDLNFDDHPLQPDHRTRKTRANTGKSVVYAAREVKSDWEWSPARPL